MIFFVAPWLWLRVLHGDVEVNLYMPALVMFSGVGARHTIFSHKPQHWSHDPRPIRSSLAKFCSICHLKGLYIFPENVDVNGTTTTRFRTKTIKIGFKEVYPPIAGSSFVIKRV